jgi:hypothetical protein
VIHVLDLIATGLAYTLGIAIICGGLFLLYHATAEALSDFRRED